MKKTKKLNMLKKTIYVDEKTFAKMKKLNIKISPFAYDLIKKAMETK